MFKNYGSAEVIFKYEGDFFPSWKANNNLLFDFEENENPLTSFEKKFEDFNKNLIFEAFIYTYDKDDFLKITIKPNNFNVADGYISSCEVLAKNYRINGKIDFEYIYKKFREGFSLDYTKLSFEKEL